MAYCNCVVPTKFNRSIRTPFVQIPKLQRVAGRLIFFCVLKSFFVLTMKHLTAQVMSLWRQVKSYRPDSLDLAAQVMSLWRQVKSYRPDSLDLAAHVFVETSQVLSSRFT
jgi:hypothetical protein